MTDRQALSVAILALLAFALLAGLAVFFMGGGWTGLLVYTLTLVAVVVGAAI